MSRRHNLKPASDSLDLLLDAMCNMFGGVVLISVMMALLSREQAVSEQSTKLASEARELLQRRIARAESDLKAAQDLQSSMSQRETDPSVLAAGELMRQREDLKARIENARDALAKADRTRTTTRASQYEDPGERQRALLEEMSKLQQAQVKLKNRIASLTEEIPRLEKRLTDIGERFTQVRADATYKLRLPREKAVTKTPFYVFIRYGEIFPRYRIVGNELKTNDTSITWLHMGEALKAVPIRGRGISVLNEKNEKRPAGLSEMEEWLKPLSRDSAYITFIVYADSFAAFNAAKERASSMGLEFGWAPFEGSEEIIFSEKGQKTPPPL